MEGLISGGGGGGGGYNQTRIFKHLITSFSCSSDQNTFFFLLTGFKESLKTS